MICESKFTVLLVFLLWIVLPVLANLYPSSSLSINSGEGFIVRLNLESSASISDCTLIYDSMNSYQLLSGSSSFHVTPTFETIESLTDRDECGARVKNVSDLSPARWRFQAELQDARIIEDTLQLSILHSITDTEIISVTGNAGEFGTITCPGEESEQRYCEIIDPLRSKTTQSCTQRVKFPPTTADDVEKYICRVWFWGRLDVVRTEIHVSSHENTPKVVARVIDNADHVILSCQILGEKLSVCRAESRQTQFLIMDGFQGSRYSVRDTLLNDGLCQFEIPKPLAANETAIWRIHAKRSVIGWTGCLFDLTNGQESSDQEYASFKESLEKVVSLETRENNVEIPCGGGPYPLNYCYLKTPRNSIVQPTINEMKLFSQYGLCTFNAEAITGRYTCGYNSRDHSEDLRQHFDVKRIEPSVFGETFSLEEQVDSSNEVHLLCYALQDYSINSCIFLAPNGEVFNIPNSSYANDRFGYHGKGFAEGECGIVIFNVDYESHLGEWICSMNLIDHGQVDLSIVVRGNGNFLTIDVAKFKIANLLSFRTHRGSCHWNRSWLLLDSCNNSCRICLLS